MIKNTDVNKTPQQILRQYFGYSEFRSGQLEIIENILQKKDCLAVLPTGGGKSLCFQIPGIIFPGITLVISPLISLMQDQVEALQKKNISATYINSSLSDDEKRKRYENMRNGVYKFIYIAPERLQNKTFLTMCQKNSISLIAIDEAHCVSMWGHDFRPNYKKISDFYKKISQRPVVAAFTATATKRVQAEIIQLLQLSEPKKFTNSFLRENLILHNFYCHTQFEKEIALLRIIKKHHNEAGIIYASTRQKTEYVAQLLNFLLEKFLSAPILFYHGGMTAEKRAAVQEKFLKNETSLIVATNAFGMGVDKSNIRYVIHYQIPGNLENYYQEAGRAGRDRKMSACYLLFYPPDIKIQAELIRKSFPQLSPELKKLKIQKLVTMGNYAESNRCLQKKIMEYFGENHGNNFCSVCSICLKIAEQDLVSKNEFKKIKKIFIFVKRIADLSKIPPNQILSQKAIQLITLLQPIKKNDFLRIPGLGKGWAERWYVTIQRYLQTECPL